MIRSIFIFLAFLVLLSCNRQEDPITRFANKHPKGEVIPKVVCGNAPSYNYCLYLPKAYDPGTPMPVVYIFDPDGDGLLPVNLMKDAAEKLGYILVGSNNSRNGIDANEVRKIIRILLENTSQNLAIDKQRMYAAGFSGGARVACSMALTNASIRGVIACSASFQPGAQPPDFDFIGIAGNHDMNYLEVARLTKYLASINTNAVLLTFDGEHGWPPEKTLANALILLDIYAMKNGVTKVDKSVVEQFEKQWLDDINELKNKGNIAYSATAYQKSAQAVRLLDGFTNIDPFKNILDELDRDPDIHQWLLRKDSLETAEAEKQQLLARALQSQKSLWWNQEFNALNRTAEDTAHPLESDMAFRLLGFISLNCYGLVNQALAQQNPELLRFYNQIYLQSDPDNYYAWYAQAILALQDGRNEDAISDLRKSIQYGYPNPAKLKNDPFLKSLKDHTEFQKLTGR